MNILKDLLESNGTLLGIGPVTNEVIEIGNKLASKENPLLLICSRRQVESEELGKAYVTSTENIGNLITNENLILCRDHGGPYQGINETYDRSIQSLKKDIEYGFKLLHIDVCKLNDSRNQMDYLSSVINICLHLNPDILFEVGTDIEGMKPPTKTEFINYIESILTVFGENITSLVYIVLQTDTYVRETKQMGIVDFDYIKELVDIAHAYGLKIKEHNCDYIQYFKEHSKIGIDAINIAPEFGYIQTKILLDYLYKNNPELFDYFIVQVGGSNRWKKWLIDPNKVPSYEARALIAGHYFFNTECFNTKIQSQINFEEVKQLWLNALEKRITNILKDLN